MGLTMREKRSVAALKAAGYRQARKQEKTKRLDELVELTHYTRRHARRLLSQHGKKLWVKPKTKVVGGIGLRATDVRDQIKVKVEA